MGRHARQAWLGLKTFLLACVSSVGLSFSVSAGSSFALLGSMGHILASPRVTLKVGLVRPLLRLILFLLMLLGRRRVERVPMDGAKGSARTLDPRCRCDPTRSR